MRIYMLRIDLPFMKSGNKYAFDDDMGNVFRVYEDGKMATCPLRTGLASYLNLLITDDEKYLKFVSESNMEGIKICGIACKQPTKCGYTSKEYCPEFRTYNAVAQATEMQCQEQFQQERAEIYHLVSSHVAEFALRYCSDIKGDFAREVQKLLKAFDSESLKKQILGDKPLTALSQQEREKSEKRIGELEQELCHLRFTTETEQEKWVQEIDRIIKELLPLNGNGDCFYCGVGSKPDEYLIHFDADNTWGDDPKCLNHPYYQDVINKWQALKAKILTKPDPDPEVEAKCKTQEDKGK